ncbi:MAG: PilN domain-containing protein, partial [Aureliella sp.]
MRLMFAPSHTLLILTSRVVARVDLAGRKRVRVEQVWFQPCTDAIAPAAAALAALNLGPRRAGRVWILSGDFWTGVVHLGADVSALLGDAELHQALALEAEIDSGVSAFASRVGAVRLSEPATSEASWCVTHIDTAELEHFNDALKRSNVHIAGAAHPAAAHIAQSAAQGELNVAEYLHGWDERFCEVGDENPDYMRAAVSELADCWAACLAQTPTMPLVVRFDPKPLSTAQRMAASAAMALLAAAACGVWHWRTEQRITAADAALASLEQRQTAGDASQRNLQVLETRLAKLRKEASQAENERRELERSLHRADEAHAQHNERWTSLLDAIAGSIDDQCWIQRLESQPVQATVHGLAIDNAAAHRFASALELGLAGSGWTVLPAETRSTEQHLVAFKIVLEARHGSREADRGDVAEGSTRFHKHLAMPLKAPHP